MLLNVKPTRMELLRLRKRIELARKGHKLLKEKRDALFSEFYKEMNAARQLRSDTETLLGNAFESLAIAQAKLGILNLEAFAEDSSITSKAMLSVSEKNIMGARVPLLKASGIRRTLLERGYSIIGSSSVLDESAEKFESVLEKIVSLAEKEASVARLSFEIAITKRKVNSLEKIIIPKLESSTKYIEQRLEEREREAFYSMKKVKAKKYLRQYAL